MDQRASGWFDRLHSLRSAGRQPVPTYRRAVWATLGAILCIGVFINGLVVLTTGLLSQRFGNSPLSVADVEFIVLTVVVLAWLAPLAVAGGFWLALLQLRHRQLQEVLLALLALNSLFFSVTLAALDGIAYLQGRLHVTPATPFLEELRAPTALRAIWDFPDTIPALLLLIVLTSVVSLALAWLFAPWRTLRHGGGRVGRAFLRVYGMTSCIMVLVFAVLPTLLGLFLYHVMRGASSGGRETVIWVVQLIIVPATVVLVAAVNTWRSLAPYARPARRIDALSDEALSLSIESLAGDPEA